MNIVNRVQRSDIIMMFELMDSTDSRLARQRRYPIPDSNKGVKKRLRYPSGRLMCGMPAVDPDTDLRRYYQTVFLILAATALPDHF
jgi:hypothetical protein